MAIADYNTSAGLNVTISGINIGEGMARADVNGAIRQQMADSKAFYNIVSASDLGVLAAGFTQTLDQSKTFTGNATGTSSIYARRHVVTANGANAFDVVRAEYVGAEHNGTGLMNTLYGLHTYAWVKSTGNVANVRVNESHFVVNSSGSVTGTAIVYNVADTTFGTGTVGGVTGYNCGTIGHLTLVNVAVCFNAINQPACPGSTIGFRSEMLAGTNKWGFLATGTANNGFVGMTRFGDTVAPTEMVDVLGNTKVSGVYKVAANQVVGARGAAIADAANSAAAPTKAEFDALVLVVNTVLARLRIATGHGLIA